MNKYMVNFDLRQGGAERVFHTLSCDRTNKFKFIILNDNSDFSYKKNDCLDRIKVLTQFKSKWLSYIALLLFFIKNPGSYISFKYNISFLLIVGNFFLLKKRKIYTRVISSISREKNEVNFIRKCYINFALKNSSGVILQSKGMINDLLASNVTEYKVINNPLGKKKKVNLVKEKKRFVIFVGRIDPVKQIDHIIESYANSTLPKQNIFLYIIGDGCDDLKSELKNKARYLGVSEFVVFIGAVSDVHNYYYHADGLILASKYEGFPNVLSEAISYNCPVISYNCVSGPSDIIVNNVNGFLIPQDNIDLLTKKMNKLSIFSGASIEHTIEQFNCEYISEKYENYVK